MYSMVVMLLSQIVTYTLVLIGTVKYHYPLISPMTQAIIAPFEFAVIVLFIVIGELGFNYASAAYLYWSLIEIIIFLVILKSGFIKKKHIVPYISFVVILTAIMIYFVAIKGYMLFFSYLNTFIGDTIWLRYILKKDYPMGPIALAAFITKCIADIFAAIVYSGDGDWLTNIICILLPILDFAFITMYFRQARKKVVQKAN